MGYLGQIEIITKKVKKGVDKGGWVWYSIEAVRQDGGHNWKAANDGTEKFEKTWKKFLTKRVRSAKLCNRRTTRRVPCKLNNVTENTKHQKGFGCFKALKKACENNRQNISLKLWF